MAQFMKKKGKKAAAIVAKEKRGKKKAGITNKVHKKSNAPKARKKADKAKAAAGGGALTATIRGRARQRHEDLISQLEAKYSDESKAAAKPLRKRKAAVEKRENTKIAKKPKIKVPKAQPQPKATAEKAKAATAETKTTPETETN